MWGVWCGEVCGMCEGWDVMDVRCEVCGTRGVR